MAEGQQINPELGEVELNLRETQYKIKFDWSALSEFEVVNDNKSLYSYFNGTQNEIVGKLGFRVLRNALWAGLRATKSGDWPKPESLEHMLRVNELVYYLKVITKAMTLANGMPVTDKGETEENPLKVVSPATE